MNSVDMFSKMKMIDLFLTMKKIIVIMNRIGLIRGFMAKRVTIMIDDSLDKKLRNIQAKMFSKFVKYNKFF